MELGGNSKEAAFTRAEGEQEEEKKSLSKFINIFFICNGPAQFEWMVIEGVACYLVLERGKDGG